MSATAVQGAELNATASRGSSGSRSIDTCYPQTPTLPRLERICRNVTRNTTLNLGTLFSWWEVCLKSPLRLTQNRFVQIGDVLFKVPLYRLQWSESSVFRTLFSLPPVSAHEGKADGTPVTLNVLLEEFEALMRILYGP